MSDQQDGIDTVNWRSILTLVTFMLTNIFINFPFQLPFLVYRPLYEGPAKIERALKSRTASKNRRTKKRDDASHSTKDNPTRVPSPSRFVRVEIPLNLNTAPLIAVLFLLLTTAIGRKEVREGTLGANNIVPIDIVLFALTVGYIARSIDASGLIRYLASKVLSRTPSGSRLYLYSYLFFFALGGLFGNDPVIQMGVLFLAHVARLCSNMEPPRAWIYMQFAIANIASTALTSSNSTNFIIAQTFGISFARYTASVIVPVAVTATVLFPWLSYLVFSQERPVQVSAKLYKISDEARFRTPVQPLVPNVHPQPEHGPVDEEAQQHRVLLEDIMSPFLDEAGALAGVILMFVTLSVLLALTAAGYNNIQVFWVTLPASFVMFCWDVGSGWRHSQETRELARRAFDGLQKRIRWHEMQNQELTLPSEVREPQDGVREEDLGGSEPSDGPGPPESLALHFAHTVMSRRIETFATPVRVALRPSWPYKSVKIPKCATSNDRSISKPRHHTTSGGKIQQVKHPLPGWSPAPQWDDQAMSGPSCLSRPSRTSSSITSSADAGARRRAQAPEKRLEAQASTELHATLLLPQLGRWLEESIPTAAHVVKRLPFSTVSFALPLFILVQSLASTGWITLLARGWGAWVDKTGTVGAVGGMGFLSVLLCNVAGTNIGATVVLSRVVQTWQASGAIPERTLWGTVLAMAIGVKYGAFSLSFAASLAGLGWRDDLREVRIDVRRMEFARANLPLVAVCMLVSCSVLVAEAYIVWDG